MGSIDREESRDRDSHRHSFSDSGRHSVPMWDSSDPERAPPPLPMNPGSPVATTRAGASSGVQAAARALTERARESFIPSSYTTNQSPQVSPEKSLIKGAQHRRMQSSQTGSGRDLRSYLDGMRTGSPERPTSRSGSAETDYFGGPTTPTPLPSTNSSKDLLKDTPSLRPTARQPPRAILQENTPPSATMRALQTMAGKDPDAPLGDITNGSRGMGSADELSAQLSKLTSIATNLQAEMAQLSRRSKDNATDLISLKEATKSRDEDIRKNLRDVVTTLNVSSPSLLGASPRAAHGFGLGLLDNKAFGSPPAMPRSASHNSFLEPDRIGSPSPYSVEGAASVAMLEKIIREMVTKEGQDRLLSSLSELSDKSTKQNSDTSKKVTELASFIKERSESKALVKSGQKGGAPQLELNFDNPSHAGSSAANGDVQKLLSKIRESVSNNGGLTAEIKALLKELRGEILGMGRELGKRLDQVGSSPDNDRSVAQPDTTRADVERVVRDSMDELRSHMEDLIQENARQSSAIVKAHESHSGQEMYAVVKHALSEHGSTVDHSNQNAGLDRETLIQAVKDACEESRPEIELQQFGLEREEILQVLKEGLEDHRGTIDVPRTLSIDREEVFSAMQDALDRVNLPQPALDMERVKDELFSSIRECLQEELRQAHPAMAENGVNRDAIHEAIRSGLEEHGDQTSRVMEISREDLFEAVQAGLDGSSIPFGGLGEQVLKQLHELIDGMRLEFKQYSAANGRDTEQVLDAVKDGLESLRASIETYVDRAQDVTGKDEIIDVVRTGLDQLRGDVRGFSAEDSSGGRAELIDYIRTEFEHLHEAIGTQGLPRDIDGRPISSNEDLKNDIIEIIQSHMSGLESRTRGNSATVADEADLSSIKDELSHLRETIAATLIKSGAAADRDEIIDAVREATSNMASSGGPSISTELLEALRGEFENLKSSISQTMVPGGSRADFDELQDTLRLGLDDLRSDIEKKLSNPDRNMAINNDILDTLNEGLDGLRSDITKTLEKPVDMTVNYEILDTLKNGLAELRTDMDKLASGSGVRPGSSRGGEIVLSDGLEGERGIVQDSAAATTAAPPTDFSSSSLKREDLQRMEVLIAALQIKVEAMDANIQDFPSNASSANPSAQESVLKEDLAGLETMLQAVQTAVLQIASREKAEVDNAVTKEDTDAIETLLRNTKAQVEELAASNPETAFTKEQLDAVEAVVRDTNDAIEGLATKVEETSATKADVAVVELLALDLKSAVDEVKKTLSNSDLDDESTRLTKLDLDVLGVMLTEIKTRVNDMALPEIETLPTTADVEQITGLLNDLRDSHDRFKENYERDIAVTAKAFDDRQQDTEQVVTEIASVKTFLEALKEDMIDRMAANEDIESLQEGVKSIQVKIEEEPAMAGDLRELMETVKAEFERAHGTLGDMKDQSEERDASGLEQHSQHREAIIAAVAEKIDASFGGFMSKHDEAQQTFKDRSAQQAELLASTKDMADELKISIDTLGTALTASTAGFNEASEKISEDSKTVFDRVDDTYNKLDETQQGLRAEHQATRDEVLKVVDGISGLQGEFTEYHPRVMMSLKELHALVSQHYEHSQKTAEEHAQASRSANEASAEQSKAHMEEIKSSFSSGFSSLPALMPSEQTTADTTTPRFDGALLEKLNAFLEQTSSKPDDAVHEKLDKLMENKGDSDGASKQLERLDEIHQQVMATAAEVTAFVSVQAKQITEGHENKERETEEVALLLERRLAQKDQVESEITGLNDEKESLRNAVEALRAEKDALAAEKSRLNADVAALHTALDIRRDELHIMNTKADALEQRILEGLMQHSRSMLLTKSSKPSPKKTKGRDLRIPSDASAATVTSTVPSLQQSHALAMKSARPPMKRNSVVPNSAERRIMSLSQISGNRTSGAGQLIVAPSLISTGPGTLKRSHSVKNGTAVLRKSSWHGHRNYTPTMETNKENDGEIEIFSDESGDEGSVLDRSERRDSHATTYGDGSYTEGITPSTEGGRRISYDAPSESLYGTGSYMTGSELDRRSSLASTIAGTLGGTIPEEEDDEEIETHDFALMPANEKLQEEDMSIAGESDVPAFTQSEVEQVVKDVIKPSYAPPSDSGLGTDLPTAALEGSESSYFGDR